MKHSKFNKVIIWGYPLYSHTHSFIHYAWYKAFKHLGYETYWFHDEDYPKDFDYENCLFIGEGYADKNIPIVNNSVYCIHLCINPKKYIEKQCRLIDLRHNVKFVQDYSYDYELDKTKLQKIDQVTYYEKQASDLALRAKYRNEISGYEALYIIWATDLLPHEINYLDINIEKERKIYHVGSYWSANCTEIDEFKNECKINNIEFIINNPWNQITTMEDAKKLIQISYIAPDIRGSGATCGDSLVEKCNHLSIGFVPCRVFKNISYGQLGATNSWAVNDIFEGRIIYNKKVKDLFYENINKKDNKELILEQMNFVKTNHTYINRINSILQIL